jgi:ribosomal protein S18 acetylase RimI-like enzyme
VEPLDNPVWHALRGPQATLAEGSGRARRYRREFAEFAALDDGADPEAWRSLTDLVGPGGLALVLTADEPRSGWQVLGTFPVRQMVLDRASSEIADLAGIDDPRVELLGRSDAASMAALVAATEPGPWSSRTHELGDFAGIRDDGRLVAMAGQRMRLAEAIEISTVCADPAYRGRGYARAVVATVAARIARAGCLPFLHVRDDNSAAIRVYETLGFRTRTLMRPGMYRAPSA